MTYRLAMQKIVRYFFRYWSEICSRDALQANWYNELTDEVICRGNFAPSKECSTWLIHALFFFYQAFINSFMNVHMYSYLFKIISLTSLADKQEIIMNFFLGGGEGVNAFRI